MPLRASQGHFNDESIITGNDFTKEIGSCECEQAALKRLPYSCSTLY